MKQLLHYTKYIFVFSFLAFALSSCEIINPSEEIPFYLRIDSISFIDSTKSPVGPAKAGTQKITDAWVFVDGIFVGTYELPATFPVLAGPGHHTVRVSAGILLSAQSTERRVYPFFTNYPISLDSVELGKTYTIKPKSSYDPIAVKYPIEALGQFPETFEGVGTIFKYTPNSKVDTIIRTDDPALVFDGDYSMIMEMNSTKDYMEFETVKAYSLPNNLRPTYMELNFRTDVNLNIGIYAIDNNTSNVTEVNFITLVPTNNTWKKVYLNVSNELSAFDNSKYKFYFKANHDSTLTSSKVLIDNVRILYK